jgi:excisionase family DNA binding protein
MNHEGNINKVSDLQGDRAKGKAALKRLLTVEETAIYLGISPRTIYNGIAPKSKNPFPIKPKRIGKLVRFDLRELDNYVDSLQS